MQPPPKRLRSGQRKIREALRTTERQRPAFSQDATEARSLGEAGTGGFLCWGHGCLNAILQGLVLAWLPGFGLFKLLIELLAFIIEFAAARDCPIGLLERQVVDLLG